MKHTLIFICLISLNLTGFGQENYTSRIGSKFFPGHLDIVVTLDTNVLRYELFNHWYSGSYAELRQISIKKDSLEHFNQSNDTISFDILDNKIHLIDKRFGINKKIRHKKLCASPENMRKISYAYKVSSNNGKVRHYELYDWEDLKLSEEEFVKIVNDNMNKLNINKN
jgi:hypothetical protein